LQVGCTRFLVSLQLKMKNFSFIFAIYLITISFVPCTDGLVQCASNLSTTEVSDSSVIHSHSNESEDDCMPFCSCSCCGSVITIITSEKEGSPLATLMISHISPYNFQYSFEYNSGMWHPPATC